jgi:hypothetical protein
MDIPEDVLDSSNLPRGVSFLPDSQSFLFSVEGNSTLIENTPEEVLLLPIIIIIIIIINVIIISYYYYSVYL